MNASELTRLVLDWSIEFVRLSMQDINRCARSNGLSFPLMNVLMHLYYQGSREVMEFAQYLQVSPASASQMVQRLVEKGLVVRVESLEDRRVREVHLTERGRDVVRESLALREHWVESIVGSLSADQQAALGQVMRQINERAGSMRPPLG